MKYLYVFLSIIFILLLVRVIYAASTYSSNKVIFQVGNPTGPKPDAGGSKVIILDPGHSADDSQRIDPASGILDHDYPNHPEIEEVFEVAQKVKQKLETDGYTVIMTKNGIGESVSHRGRADVANNANAALAVSIHTDHSAGTWNFAQVYPQKVGLYREKSDGERVTFNNSEIAQKSQEYSQIFVTERGKVEGRSVELTTVNFAGRAGLAPGNIPLVQLFATVPWVYNEVGGDGPQKLSEDKLDRYAQGLINSIKKAVPLTP